MPIDPSRRPGRSRILQTVHETAADLHRGGFIDKRRMVEFDALCIDPVGEFDSARVRDLRARLQLSQGAMAVLLNTSVSTIRKWEAGDKRPSGPSAKLLDILDRKGLDGVI